VFRASAASGKMAALAGIAMLYHTTLSYERRYERRTLP
jgi:hypothetical protein